MSESQLDRLRQAAQKSPTFCIYPFTHLATKTDGSFKLCCRSECVSHVGSESALETWNGPTYRRVRQQMLKGERPAECQACWILEDVGTRSMRQRALNEKYSGSRWNQHQHVLANYNEDGTMNINPKTMEIKISNLCNLKCRMCSPVDSTSWASEWPQVKHLHKVNNTWSYDTVEKYGLVQSPKLAGFEDNEKWWSEFENMVEHLDLIEFAGGEPLLDPSHYRLLELMAKRRSNISLKYSTNLTKLVYKGTHVFDLWRKFKSVSVYVSMDGVGDVYNYIRTNANFDSVISNLLELKNAKDLPIDELAVAFTIQVYNVFQIPEVCDYFLKHKIRLHTHRVTFPNFLCVQILPKWLKEKLTDQLLHYIQERTLTLADDLGFQSIRTHLIDHLNFLNGSDQSYLIPDFIEFTKRTDALRSTDAARLHLWLAELLSTAPSPDLAPFPVDGQT